jgi:ATP-binding cassette subfamily B multidrug efflux pump
MQPFKKLTESYHKFLSDSSFIREYIVKYKRWVITGLFFLLVVDIAELFPPILLMKVIDYCMSAKDTSGLATLTLYYLLATIATSIGRYGWRVFLIRAGISSGQDIRGRFGTHLLQQSTSFFDKNRIGELMSLSTSDVEAVRMCIGSGLLTICDALIYMAIVPFAMFKLSTNLALITLMTAPLIPPLVMKIERLIHERYRKVQEKFSDIAAHASETIYGIRIIKGLAKEDVRLKEFAIEGEKYKNSYIELTKVNSIFGPSLEYILSLGMIGLIWVGSKGVWDESVTIGTFVAFQRFIQKMLWPLMSVGMSVNFYQKAAASTRRLQEVLKIEPDVQEKIRKTPFGLRRATGKIEVRNLTFTFPGASTPALKNLSFTVEAGKRLAVLGTVGSGKTALLSVLPRLYPVPDGTVFLDDIDINDWPLDLLRDQFGFVSQENFLFSQTVKDNVGFELPQESVEEASELAQVHLEILGLPKKYSTMVGERGVLLSGGQRQRLSISRAIARKPPVLILDDALSAVDVQTEEKLLGALRSRPGRNTEIISAHRLSTIRDADLILVLDKGALRQSGTHEDLMADRRNFYRNYLESQKSKEALENYLRQLAEERKS